MRVTKIDLLRAEINDLRQELRLLKLRLLPEATPEFDDSDTFAQGLNENERLSLVDTIGSCGSSLLCRDEGMGRKS
jgi:hypothetical protein